MMTNEQTFIDRASELADLQRLVSRKTASLVVVKGRRRIGKSRLINEFSKAFSNYHFIGLPPEENTTAQTQRDEFARQLQDQIDLPPIKAEDWGDLFMWLAKSTQHGRHVIILDEITWMGFHDPAFLGKLEVIWEKYFSKNPELILILCGSVSQWIQENILSSTGYFGRIALEITLDELPLKSCDKLLGLLDFKGRALEKLQLLSVTGGVPWYIELFNPSISVSENIKALCFRKNGLLVKEYKRVFNDLFGKRGDIYRKIVESLVDSPKEYSEIVKAINYTSSGALSSYLNELIESGFIVRDFAWDFRSGKDVNISRYRLRDNYLRFYLKCIAPRLSKIQKDLYQDRALVSIPGWASIRGLQFENLVLNNRRLIWGALRINEEEIINDNPFMQRKTAHQKGCQIDYLIHTEFNILYVVEIRLSQNKIGKSVAEEVREKINRIKMPRGFAVKPVLIHVGELTEDLIEERYFAAIIDMSEFLE
jgi:hypothetical protein